MMDEQKQQNDNFTTERHVIFGTGPVGMAVMRALVVQHKPVVMVNRSGRAQVPGGVQVLKGDATDPASTRPLCAGATVVYNCTNAPYTEWPTRFPPLQAGILEGAAAAGAKLVSAENVYMYGPTDVPLTEDLPYRARTRKGLVRAQMAQTLLEAHRSGKVRVAIGRASDFFGPVVLDSMAGERMFAAALAGKRVQLLGSLDVPHTFTYIDDFGQALATLGERDETLGQAWHIPNAPAVTTRAFLQMVFEEAGRPFNVAVAPGILIRAMGLLDPMMRELAEMLYEFEQPFIIDHSKYAQAFGDHSTPLREAIHQTVAWFRARQ
jgi:nucleoside-diphosphate-sugar epimerase